MKLRRMPWGLLRAFLFVVVVAAILSLGDRALRSEPKGGPGWKAAGPDYSATAPAKSLGLSQPPENPEAAPSTPLQFDDREVASIYPPHDMKAELLRPGTGWRSDGGNTDHIPGQADIHFVTLREGSTTLVLSDEWPGKPGTFAIQQVLKMYNGFEVSCFTSEPFDVSATINHVDIVAEGVRSGKVPRQSSSQPTITSRLGDCFVS